ncbi:VCBS repeat-containing protein [Streptomyces sp. WAC01280]|uniref:FG-GAP repeat domain-containing protein n=1 Tax=Streptomyces sp. WAC01280 TaxID=2487424 RepID=UPI000F79456B|nr:VCBS repeat-containing protein [Streptomyces sp. WAC01280]RSS54833.1 VCBS repeat-containing protein [Streptomyces sp. WAC01280]
MQNRLSGRRRRRHLAAAVTAVLALTAGTALTTVPATAATAATGQEAGPAQVAADVATLPPGSQVLSAGSTGFLSTVPKEWGQPEYRWTAYETGAITVLNDPETTYLGNSSDTVFSRKAGSLTHWLHDMAHPSGILYGISVNNGTYVRGAVGTALVATTTSPSGAVSVSLYRNNSDGRTSSVAVPDLPSDVRLGKTAVTTPGTAVFSYASGSGDATRYYLAAVDTFTGQVLETRPGIAQSIGDAFLSATHWSWIEYYEVDRVKRARLATAPRGGEGTTTYTDLGELGGGNGVHTSLIGDWVTSARTHGDTAEYPSALYPLTARPLGGGTPVKLLEHVSTATTAPDGSLIARGGTVDGGEGVYRIAASDTGGAPTVTMIATLNAPTALTHVSNDVPAVLDLDRNNGRTRFTWTLSQPAVTGAFTLRHTRTGKTEKIEFATSGGTSNPGNKVRVDWAGMLGTVSAYNGDYTWEFRARPSSGIGPELKKTGSLKVVRKALPHDYTDNGTPDVLARDSAGRLWRDDLVRNDGLIEGYSTEHKLIGSGWNGYTQVEAVGNVAGAAAGDLVARDRDGNLWLYLGKGDGTFATRLKVGPGWNAYNKIAGGSDVNNDGWSDLFATDTSGVLWLYKGTGNWRTPYGSRTRVGGGWGAMNQITATGDLGGTVHGDLVARDTTGVLWLYPSTGTGTFGPRVRIGGGWGGYTHLVGAGDIDRDGRADLFAYSPGGGSYLHQGTGNLSAPLAPRMQLPVYRAGSTSYNLIG